MILDASFGKHGHYILVAHSRVGAERIEGLFGPRVDRGSSDCFHS
jgi:hypothetical protein